METPLRDRAPAWVLVFGAVAHVLAVLLVVASVVLIATDVAGAWLAVVAFVAGFAYAVFNPS